MQELLRTLLPGASAEGLVPDEGASYVHLPIVDATGIVNQTPDDS